MYLIEFLPFHLLGNGSLWLVTLGRRHGPTVPDPRNLGLNWSLTVVGLVEFVALAHFVWSRLS